MQAKLNLAQGFFKNQNVYSICEWGNLGDNVIYILGMNYSRAAW